MKPIIQSCSRDQLLPEWHGCEGTFEPEPWGAYEALYESQLSDK